MFDGNLGFHTRRSFALLSSDTSPATFWMTNPNNTWTNNVAAGSESGYGFWLRLMVGTELALWSHLDPRLHVECVL